MVLETHITFDDLPVALLLVNGDFNIVGANAKVMDIFGYEVSELVGRSINILLPVEFHERHTQLMQKYKENPVPKTLGIGRILEAVQKEGDKIPVEISLLPVGKEEFMVLVSIVDVRISMIKTILDNFEKTKQ